MPEKQTGTEIIALSFQLDRWIKNIFCQVRKKIPILCVVWCHFWVKFYTFLSRS